MSQAPPATQLAQTRRGDGVGPPLRAALVFGLMLAAAVQGVIAQAHIHFRFERSVAVAAALGYASATPDERGAPDGDANGDLSSCALCQALAAGAAPLAPALHYASPLTAFRYAAPDESAQPAFVGAVSHIWTSRGPPSA